jgi:hypothetical protein
LPDEPSWVYPRGVLQSALSALLSLVFSVQDPTLAQPSLSPSADVDVQAQALFDDGQFLAAAKVWGDALAARPESPEHRLDRNGWVTGAVNAYKAAFDASPTPQCAVIGASLKLADQYLETLVAVYTVSARNADDYVAMNKRRAELDQARAQRECPDLAVTPSASPASTGPVVVSPEPSESSKPLKRSEDATPPPPRRGSAGLAAGIGVSAGLGVAMLATSLVLYSRLRKPSGGLYLDILDAAKKSGIPTDDAHDMCEEAKKVGAADVNGACATWQSQKRAFITTSVLAGVFGVSTAVFTGLLVRKRRQDHSLAARLREHQLQFGAMPRREGGVMFVGGLRF